MELKDVILSTLAEIEEIAVAPDKIDEIAPLSEKHEPTYHEEAIAQPLQTPVSEDEARWLEGMRERLLVLFEGFQSPNNVQIEAKVDLTLNFLEYLLATIDNRLEHIKKS